MSIYKHFEKRLCCVITVLMLTVATAWAQQTRSNGAEKYGYGVDRDYVYYDGRIVAGADARTFEYLGHGYARDRNNVYYRDRILPGANPRTFRVMGDAEDDYVPLPRREPYDEYAEPRIPDELLPGESLGYGYSKTNFDVYYMGRKVDASANSFQVLKMGYAKDAFKIYFLGREVKDASALQFRVLLDGYAKDAFNVYFRGSKIADCNASRFECMGNGIGKDDENKYYWGQKVVW